VIYQRRDILKLASKRTAAGYRLHVSREAMACRFEVTMPASEQDGVKFAGEALSEAERLDRHMLETASDVPVIIGNCKNCEVESVMADMLPASLTAASRISLIVLRTLIGWHFLYEGFSISDCRAGAPTASVWARGHRPDISRLPRVRWPGSSGD